MTATTTLDLTRDEIVRQLEAGSKRRLAMSATDMISSYNKRSLPQLGAVADLLMLASLLPEEDPLHVEL